MTTFRPLPDDADVSELLHLAETDPVAARELAAGVVAVWDAYGLGRFEETEREYLLTRRLQLARNVDTRYE